MIWCIWQRRWVNEKLGKVFEIMCLHGNATVNGVLPIWTWAIDKAAWTQMKIHVNYDIIVSNNTAKENKQSLVDILTKNNWIYNIFYHKLLFIILCTYASLCIGNDRRSFAVCLLDCASVDRIYFKKNIFLFYFHFCINRKSKTLIPWTLMLTKGFAKGIFTKGSTQSRSYNLWVGNRSTQGRLSLILRQLCGN